MLGLDAAGKTSESLEQSREEPVAINYQARLLFVNSDSL
jgi:hypothetical protein